jgi:hypothetical protein
MLVGELAGMPTGQRIVFISLVSQPKEKSFNKLRVEEMLVMPGGHALL